LIDIRERQLRAGPSEGASDTQSDPARSSGYECGLSIDTLHAPNLPLATKRTSALSAVRICFTALFEDPWYGFCDQTHRCARNSSRDEQINWFSR
jgi:hypothetical protein